MAACLAGVSAARDDKRKGAAPRPDLSGTWVLDRSKSNYGDARGRNISKDDVTLVITHRDPELRFTKTVVNEGRQETKEYVYYTDGRGETNPMYYGSGEVDSKTRWDGDRLETLATLARVGRANQGAGYYLAMEAKWRLSDDGRTLTHTNYSVNPGEEGGSQETRLVYRRAS